MCFDKYSQGWKESLTASYSKLQCIYYFIKMVKSPQNFHQRNLPLFLFYLAVSLVPRVVLKSRNSKCDYNLFGMCCHLNLTQNDVISTKLPPGWEGHACRYCHQQGSYSLIWHRSHCCEREKYTLKKEAFLSDDGLKLLVQTLLILSRQEYVFLS